MPGTVAGVSAVKLWGFFWLCFAWCRLFLCFVVLVFWFFFLPLDYTFHLQDCKHVFLQ